MTDRETKAERKQKIDLAVDRYHTADCEADRRDSDDVPDELDPPSVGRQLAVLRARIDKLEDAVRYHDHTED